MNTIKIILTSILLLVTIQTQATTCVDKEKDLIERMVADDDVNNFIINSTKVYVFNALGGNTDIYANKTELKHYYNNLVDELNSNIKNVSKKFPSLIEMETSKKAEILDKVAKISKITIPSWECITANISEFLVCIGVTTAFARYRVYLCLCAEGLGVIAGDFLAAPYLEGAEVLLAKIEVDTVVATCLYAFSGEAAAGAVACLTVDYFTDFFKICAEDEEGN